MSSPYYILRLDKVDESLPEGRASVATRLFPEELDEFGEIALSSLSRRLAAFIAVHEQGIGE